MVNLKNLFKSIKIVFKLIKYHPEDYQDRLIDGFELPANGFNKEDIINNINSSIKSNIKIFYDPSFSEKDFLITVRLMISKEYTETDEWKERFRKYKDELKHSSLYSIFKTE